MTGMRKTIALDWRGERFNLLVTMEVVDRLDEAVNLAVMASRVAGQDGGIRWSHAAKLLAAVLTEAGARDATAEAVYTDIFESGVDGPRKAVALVSAILQTTFPDIVKKPDAEKESESTGSADTPLETCST